MAQRSNGNTNHSRVRKRNWTFTLNNYTKEEEKKFTTWTVDKYFYGYEIAPTTGTPHLQGFMIFKNPRTANGIKKMFPRIHLEVMNSTIMANLIYCTKDMSNMNVKTNIENWESMARGTDTFSNNESEEKKIRLNLKKKKINEEGLFELLENIKNYNEDDELIFR